MILNIDLNNLPQYFKKNTFSFFKNGCNDILKFQKEVTNNCDFYDFLEGDIRIFKNGKPIEDSLYLSPSTEGKYIHRRLNKLVLKDYFFDGYTVIYEALNKKIVSLRDICDKISKLLHCKCWVNGYLTPPESSGFVSHKDDHHVIVIQLIGRKTWTIESEELVIDQGDLLIIPEGITHSAKTNDSISFHLTLGVKYITLEDILSHLNKTGIYPFPQVYFQFDKNFPDYLNKYTSNIDQQIINEGIENYFLEFDQLFETISKIESLNNTSKIRVAGIYKTKIQQDFILVYSKSKEIKIPIAYHSFIMKLFANPDNIYTVADFEDIPNFRKLIFELYKHNVIFIN